MNLEQAIADIAEYNRKIQLIEAEITRFGKMRDKFQTERDAIQSYIDLYPTYIIDEQTGDKT